MLSNKYILGFIVLISIIAVLTLGYGAVSNITRIGLDEEYSNKNLLVAGIIKILIGFIFIMPLVESLETIFKKDKKARLFMMIPGFVAVPIMIFVLIYF
ncbi:MAG: hypothetical protein COA79_13620 [Planctomycetota bacterium]|nr:MAG: hypothetical protein COA79_13620 [Planctomycetota bacterium]